MTKTLTEQWKDGTLDQRYYYVKFFGNCQKPFVEIELKNFLLDLAKVRDNDRIEVLAAVPSYDEYKRLVSNSDESVQKMHILEKQLAIATKALELYSKDDYISDSGGRSVMSYPHIARKALKYIKEVK